MSSGEGGDPAVEEEKACRASWVGKQLRNKRKSAGGDIRREGRNDIYLTLGVLMLIPRGSNETISYFPWTIVERRGPVRRREACPDPPGFGQHRDMSLNQSLEFNDINDDDMNGLTPPGFVKSEPNRSLSSTVDGNIRMAMMAFSLDSSSS